jgi:hypothetical protein
VTSLADMVLSRARELAWLPAGSTDGRLVFSGARTLAAELEARWRGRRFNELRFVTGSTDRDGAMLRWLADTFGLRKAVGAVTPERCSFDVKRLAKLPLDVQLTSVEPPYTHAKAYHLTGPDGDVLLIGSPNCSRSAWLLPSDRGGNIESLLVYERPNRQTLVALDSLFRGKAERPAAVLTSAVGPETPSTRVAPAYRVSMLQFQEDGRIAARLVPEPPPKSSFELTVGDQTLVLQRSDDGWHGPVPERLPFDQTTIARYEIRTGDGRVHVQGRRWMDDVRVLQHAGHARRIPDLVNRLARSGTDREDGAQLQALAQLMNDLVEDTSAIGDPRRVTRRPKPDEGECGTVDPARLITALRDEVIRDVHPLHTAEGALSMAGIFRVLFAGEDGSETDDGRRPESDDPDVEQSPERVPPTPAQVSERNRQRFERHMEKFMAALDGEKFRTTCRARQMVESIAFPFAVAALFVERGWTDEDRAREWVLAAVRLLLYGKGKDAPPLLDTVRARYAAEQQEDIFRYAVGNGLLWVTMVAGLHATRWPSTAEPLERAVLLRDLWMNEFLAAESTAEQTEALVRRYRAGAAVQAFRAEIGPIVAALAAVEMAMEQVGVDVLLELQEEINLPVGVGEILWGRRNGWAVVLEPQGADKALVYWARQARTLPMRLGGHFIRLGLVSSADPELEWASSELHAVLGPGLPRRSPSERPTPTF